MLAFTQCATRQQPSQLDRGFERNCLVQRTVVYNSTTKRWRISEFVHPSQHPPARLAMGHRALV